MAKILIVDDDTKVLELYSAILAKEGYRVFTTSDGKKGFDLALSEKPDLILLDVMMPEVDGAEVCAQLSQNPGTKEIKVVFLTAIIKDEEAEGTGAIGGRTYISKSTPREKFISRIKEILPSQ